MTPYILYYHTSSGFGTYRYIKSCRISTIARSTRSKKRFSLLTRLHHRRVQCVPLHLRCSLASGEAQKGPPYLKGTLGVAGPPKVAKTTLPNLQNEPCKLFNCSYYFRVQSVVKLAQLSAMPFSIRCELLGTNLIFRDEQNPCSRSAWRCRVLTTAS